MLSNDDARFDFNLRLWLIQDSRELANSIDVFFHVSDDKRVAAAVDLNRASTGEPARNDGQASLISTASSGIAASATAEAEVCGATRKCTSLARGLRHASTGTAVIMATQFRHQWRG